MSIKSTLLTIRSHPVFFIKSFFRALFTAINRSLTVFSAHKVVAREGVDTADRILMPVIFASGLLAYYKNKTASFLSRTILTAISRAVSTANVKHILMQSIRTRDWTRLTVTLGSYVLNTYVYYDSRVIQNRNHSVHKIKKVLEANLTAMARIVTFDSLYLLIVGGGWELADFGFFSGALIISALASYQTGNVYRSSARAATTACNRGLSVVLLRHILPGLMEAKDQLLLTLMIVTFTASLPVYFDTLRIQQESPKQNEVNGVSSNREKNNERESGREDSPLLRDDSSSRGDSPSSMLSLV